MHLTACTQLAQTMSRLNCCVQTDLHCLFAHDRKHCVISMMREHQMEGTCSTAEDVKQG